MKLRDFNKVINKIKLIYGVKIVEKNTDHRRVSIFFNEKLIMRTKISYGSKIKSGDIKNISNDLHFRVDEIKPYERCKISNETYLETLRKRNIIKIIN